MTRGAEEKRQTRWVNSFETLFFFITSSSLSSHMPLYTHHFFKLCSHVKCCCITLPSLHTPSPVFSSLILMISNRRLGRESGWEEAGTAMWRVRLTHGVLIIEITARSAPKGFWRAVDGRVIISSRAAWQKHRLPTSWNITKKREWCHFWWCRGKCSDATIVAFVLNGGVI